MRLARRVKGVREDTMAHEPEPQAAREPLMAGGAGAAGAGTDYEALLAERDAKIAESEGAIAEAQSSPRRSSCCVRRWTSRNARARGSALSSSS
mgnify:CR=1 FL=1